jgi:GT2 family glycosyltransferase
MLSDIKAISGHCFDDRYFAYGEDLDLTLRAQLRGWQCFFSPSLVTWHTHSGSLGGKVRLWEKPPTIRRHSLRNRYTTILKDLPFGVMLYLAPFLVISEIAAWPFFLTFSPGTIPCLVGAYLETLSQLPSTWRLRRVLQNTRVVSNRSLLQFYRGF